MRTTLTFMSLALAAGTLAAQTPTVTVVNMIPRSMSGETRCDGEPSIAVNPGNTQQIAGSAFTPNPSGGSLAPYYVSTNGGSTWTLNAVIPGGSATADVSLRFGSGAFYAAILRRDNFNLNILRKADFSTSTGMTILVNRADDDQPWVDTRTISGKDRVYVANNDFNGTSGRTATVDLSADAATATAPAGFAPARIETRTTVGQDGPSVRSASAPDGRVYAAFLGWRSNTSGTKTYTSDIVVVRDDAGATGTTKFRSLLGSDGSAGVKLATGQRMTFDSRLGSNRVGSSLAIAVDPTDSRRVYVAWGEDGSGGEWTLHLRRSVDGGATWSSDLRTIAGATNPALAVNSSGRVGFLYQQLASGTWRNQVEFSTAAGAFSSPTTVTLANLTDSGTSTCGQPTIGDYAGLASVGADFYGVFSGNNRPVSSAFPNGVTYQRNVNWSSSQLLGTDGVTAVSNSIDPFYFRVTGLESTSAPVINTQPANATVAVGSTATFTVSATGNPAPTYQWRKNGVAISGATSSSYTTPATTSADNGSTFSVVVSNSVGSVTSSNATLTVTSNPELVVNGGFESGTTGWSGTTGDIGAWSGQPARTGTRCAWLMGNGRSATEYLQQTITVPASGATLNFWMHIDTAETDPVAYDTLKVQVITSTGATTTLATYSNLHKNTGYALRSFNLGAWAGQTVRIKFLGSEDGSLQTSFVLDDVSAR